MIITIAWFAGSLEPAGANWGNARLNMIVGSSVGILMALLTEEGFFRGWLWATLERAGQSAFQVVVWSSVAFVLWHLSPVLLDTGFNPPPSQIPVYLLNAFLIGVLWGLLRLLSGSVVVSSVGHAVWNGLAYPLFGFGKEAGALGIERTDLFGPEVGWLGLALNAAFVMAVGLYWRRRGRSG